MLTEHLRQKGLRVRLFICSSLRPASYTVTVLMAAAVV